MRIGTSEAVEVRRAEIEGSGAGGGGVDAVVTAFMAARYRALALALGAWVIDTDGDEVQIGRRDWRWHVATMLDVSRRKLVAILAEKRGALTAAMLARAVERLRLPADYFTNRTLRDMSPEQCGAAWEAACAANEAELDARYFARSVRALCRLPAFGPISVDAALEALVLEVLVVAAIENPALDDYRPDARRGIFVARADDTASIMWGIGSVIVGVTGPRHTAPSSDDDAFAELVGRMFVRGPLEGGTSDRAR